MLHTYRQRSTAIDAPDDLWRKPQCVSGCGPTSSHQSPSPALLHSVDPGAPWELTSARRSMAGSECWCCVLGLAMRGAVKKVPIDPACSGQHQASPSVMPVPCLREGAWSTVVSRAAWALLLDHH